LVDFRGCERAGGGEAGARGRGGGVAQHPADWSTWFREDDAGSSSPHHSAAMTLDEALETTASTVSQDCSPVGARSALRVPFARLTTRSATPA
jgi:hypothetical protein